MSRDEFYLIKKYIRFYDEKDQFYKVRPLVDEVLTNTNNYYNPSKFLTLDESMIKFGNLIWSLLKVV